MNVQLMVNNVSCFFQKMKFQYPSAPTVLKLEVVSFRSSCMMEELRELNSADNFPDFIDAIIDLSYFTVGTLLLLGKEAEIASRVKQFETSQLVRNTIYTMMLKKNFTIVFEQHTAGFAEHARIDHYTAAEHLYDILSYCQLIFRTLNLSFDKHWHEVHMCNMKKEPATPENAPNRGLSAYYQLDAVKPKGWVGPDHLKVLTGGIIHALL